MGWWECIHHARDCHRWIDGEQWSGICMGEYETARHDFITLAKKIRDAGFRAKTVIIQGGTIGMTGLGGNLVKRSVVVMPDTEQRLRQVSTFLEEAIKLEAKYW